MIKHTIRSLDEKKPAGSQNAVTGNQSNACESVDKIVQKIEKQTLNLSGKSLGGSGKGKRGKRGHKSGGGDDANKVKKAMNPYLCYVKANRARLGAENPGKGISEIMQLISQLWKKTTREEKQIYENMAAEDKLRHMKEVKYQRENPPQKNQANKE